MTITDKLLLERLQKGDEMAYRQVFLTYYASLSKIAYGFLLDDFLAQTVADDVLFSFWEKRESIVINSSLNAYLARSVKNKCLNILNESRTQRELSFSVMGDAFADTYFESSVDSAANSNLSLQELQQAIDQSLATLSPECRRVFEASRWDNMSYEEIATTFSISTNTVKYHIKHALVKLKKDLLPFMMWILFLNLLPLSPLNFVI